MRTPAASNFPFQLSRIFALLLSRFFAPCGALPRLFQPSFDHIPTIFRHFAVCRNLHTFAPSLQYRLPAIPVGTIFHEVVRRSKAVSPLVADAHPPNHPSNLGSPIQELTPYVANAPRDIYPKLPVWRENTGRTFINLKYLFYYGKR